MAREHARVKLAMWDDDDFRALSPQAQHLYFVLQTSPSLSYCGVADWRPKRIAALARGWTPEQVEEAAVELMQGLYILVDESTEEVLVRSFIRDDGLMARERMATAMAKAHSAVASPAIRGVLVHELKQLHSESSNLFGWKAEKALPLLTKNSIEPSTMPLTMACATASAMPLPIDPSVLPPTTSSLLLAPSSKLLSSEPLRAVPELELEIEEAKTPKPQGRKKSAKPLPDDWAPTDVHRDFASKHSLNLDGEVFKFRNHAHANARTQVSWNASFSTWLANALEWRTPRQAAAAGPFKVWAEE